MTISLKYVVYHTSKKQNEIKYIIYIIINKDDPSCDKKQLQVYTLSDMFAVQKNTYLFSQIRVIIFVKPVFTTTRRRNCRHHM